MENENPPSSPVSKQKKISSTRGCFKGAKRVQYILTAVYACLFVWEAAYLPRSISRARSSGRGDRDYFPSPPSEPPPPAPFSVDILSVSSVGRTELLHAQKRTFGSHGSVRNFFNATEADDDDPKCHEDLTMDDVRKVSDFCRRRTKGISREMFFLRGMYARVPWLEKKPDAVGWLCAMPRPYAGLRKVRDRYREGRQKPPDYLLLLDDDSYYNMESFARNHERLDSLEPTVVAGCLVRQPIHQINFTFPFGGFGTVFSKGALNYLFHPIICPDIGGGDAIPMIANHANSEGICNQLSQNVAGELRYFQNGMSLLDLIHKYVTADKYRDVDKWTSGFCMHSDWVLGFFVNFYNASTQNPFYKHLPRSRIQGYKGSEIYGQGTGYCTNERQCRKGSEICHKPPVEWMEMETRHWRSNNSL